MSACRLIVVSDLHVSAGELDNFDAELENHFCKFLRLEACDGTATELVINGDFLDFVQAPPSAGKGLFSKSSDDVPLCFTEEQSAAKFAAIAAAHPVLFNHLRAFLLHNSDNCITLLPGNHDVDMFWPSIRQALTEEIAKTNSQLHERIRFHLQLVYRPSTFPTIWIEHGHQYDYTNRFALDDTQQWSDDTPPIRIDTSGERRLIECLGTRFLTRFLNTLNSSYPFVDNVKPFSRFIHLFALSALHPGYGSLQATAAAWGLLRYLTATTLASAGDLLSLPPSSLLDERGAAAGRFVVASLSADRRILLAKSLRAAGVPIDRSLELIVATSSGSCSLLDALAEHQQLLPDQTAYSSDLSLKRPIGQDASSDLGLVKGFITDETRALVEGARAAAAEPGVTAVIMGHTHEVQDSPNDVPYINTGCWIRYANFRHCTDLQPWKLLSQHGAAHFPYSLHFALVSSQRPKRARLVKFHPT